MRSLWEHLALNFKLFFIFHSLGLFRVSFLASPRRDRRFYDPNCDRWIGSRERNCNLMTIYLFGHFYVNLKHLIEHSAILHSFWYSENGGGERERRRINKYLNYWRDLCRFLSLWLGIRWIFRMNETWRYLKETNICYNTFIHNSTMIGWCESCYTEIHSITRETSKKNGRDL